MEIMEPEKENWRFYIFTRMKLGEFHENPPGVGIGELVRHATADDPHISIQEISELCYLSHGTVHRIIHEEHSMKKVCAKWVPHFLTGAQSSMERVRCAKQMPATFEPQGPKRLTCFHRG